MDIQHIQNNRITLLLEYSPLFCIYGNVQVSLYHYSSIQHKVFYGNSAYNKLYNSFRMEQTYLYQFFLAFSWLSALH